MGTFRNLIALACALVNIRLEHELELFWLNASLLLVGIQASIRSSSDLCKLNCLHHLANLLSFENETIGRVYARFWLAKRCQWRHVWGCVCVTHASWDCSILVCFKLVLQGCFLAANEFLLSLWAVHSASFVPVCLYCCSRWLLWCAVTTHVFIWVFPVCNLYPIAAVC